MSAPNQIQKLRGEGQPARVQDNVGQVLNPVAQALSQTPIMGAPPPPWIPFYVLTGWTAHYLHQPGTAVPAFHRDALGYVHVKGVWHNSSGGPSSANMTQFPLGYRPAEENDFPAAVSGGNAQSVIVTPDGFMRPDANVPNNGHIHTSFSFLAEQ